MLLVRREGRANALGRAHGDGQRVRATRVVPGPRDEMEAAGGVRGERDTGATGEGRPGRRERDGRPAVHVGRGDRVQVVERGGRSGVGEALDDDSNIEPIWSDVAKVCDRDVPARVIEVQRRSTVFDVPGANRLVWICNLDRFRREQPKRCPCRPVVEPYHWKHRPT